jgi:hypothetical protein
MTRHFSRFQGLSRAESGRKEPVLAEVGNNDLHSNVNAGEVRELLAGYRSYSAVGPFSDDEPGYHDESTMPLCGRHEGRTWMF